MQRVLIARALAQVDEPTSHLDLYHKFQILKLLKNIAHHRQKTIVFSSHEIEMAIQLSNKILLLSKEKNRFEEPREVIEQKAFETLFPADTVVFNRETGSFRMEK